VLPFPAKNWNATEMQSLVHTASPAGLLCTNRQLLFGMKGPVAQLGIEMNGPAVTVVPLTKNVTVFSVIGVLKNTGVWTLTVQLLTPLESLPK
jgi:hypothetical protein